MDTCVCKQDGNIHESSSMSASYRFRPMTVSSEDGNDSEATRFCAGFGFSTEKCSRLREPDNLGRARLLPYVGQS